jgi:cytochrome c5
MKQISVFFLSVASIFFWAQCSPKVKPTTSSTSSSSSADKTSPTEVKKDAPAATPTATSFYDLHTEDKMAVAMNRSDAENNSGYTVYQSKCAKCHDLPNPQSKDMGGWVRIMESMSRKAKLDDEEYKNVLGYLYQNCKR